MSGQLGFATLIHADWSIAAVKCWQATARREAGGWLVQAPAKVGPPGAFLDHAFAAARAAPVLLGLDFPIGVPAAYGGRTGLADFPALLSAIGHGDWADFATVAVRPDQIGPQRPFYPAASRAGVRRAELVAGHGVAGFHDLLRVCERRTADRREACSLFWTLGGNQVGKAALQGWRDILTPARARGARLWPFDGTLAALAATPGLTIAETYPAAAYAMVGAGFTPRQSKRRQADRATKAGPVRAWAATNGVVLTPAAQAALDAGFGADPEGEDAFDALLGLLKMIAVADGRHPERTEPAPGWEGWILGR